MLTAISALEKYDFKLFRADNYLSARLFYLNLIASGITFVAPNNFLKKAKIFWKKPAFDVIVCSSLQTSFPFAS